MGLSIVLGIVKGHGGFIQVNSKPGEGTKFTVYFPALDSAPSGRVEEVSIEHAKRNERILFVDDEEMLATMGGSMLRRCGYEVTVKTSSSAALETFKSTPAAFDLVITDQSMPNMSGAELSTELLKIRPDLPIILCSGYSKKITEKDAKKLGIRKYLTKPFDIKGLVESIKEALQQ